MNKFLMAAVLGSTLLAGPAFAQTPPAGMQPPPPGGGRGMGMGGMMRADANHDGVITREEYLAMLDRQFAMIDGNGDGQVTKQEMEDAASAMMAMAPGGRPPAPPAGAGNGDAPPPPGGRRMGGGMGGRMLERADTNGDGNVSRDEYRAQAMKRFDRLDANHDGKIDQAEMQAMRDMMRARMGGAGAPGGDMPPPPPAGE